MKIKVIASGYYNSTNNRVCLLKEGEILNSTSYDKSFDGWMCEAATGQTVWIEKKNGIVLD